MRACRDGQEQLLDYALGVPAGPELLAHLERCPECARLLAAWRSGAEQLDSGVKQLVRSEPPPFLSTRVLARIQAEPAPMGWALRWKAVLATAVLAGLVSLSFYAFHVAAVRREETRQLTAAAAALSRWRSPTDILLRSSVDLLLKSTPGIGEPLFEMRVPAKGTKKIGGKNEK